MSCCISTSAMVRRRCFPLEILESQRPMPPMEEKFHLVIISPLLGFGLGDVGWFRLRRSRLDLGVQRHSV